jgi:Cu-Zn family superoxide dismutase
MSMSNRASTTGVVLAAAALIALIVLAVRADPSAAADGGMATKGTFAAFATSRDPAIAGQATMVRTADGRTLVSVSVRGLAPSTAYGAHVHAQACADGFAGGHYRNDPAGAPVPPNEIWPAFTTNAAGVGAGFATADWLARPEARSVVIHAPGGAKIACADLEAPE